MKKITRFLLCVCVCWLVPVYAFAENNILSGKIVLQNSGGEPSAGVQVSAIGASPTTSKSMGEFELVFADRREGDRVFLTLKKEGFEVVNREELEPRIPADAKEIVVIVMCKTGERDRHAMMYYRIAEKSIQEGYETELKRINDNYEKTVKEKNAELENLKIQRDAALAQAKDLSEKFAQVNLDEASEMYKQAFALFQYGKVEEARQVLDDAKMDQALAAAKKLEEESKKAIQQSIENYMLKVRLCIIGFQFAEAEKNFHKAVDADPENYDNTFAFAYYLQKQNQHTKAFPLYEKALSLAEKQKDEEKIATVLNNLGILYKDKNDYAAAEKAYLRALEIYEKLSLSNLDTYLPDLAMTQNNLGNFYYIKNDYAAAEKAYLRALKIYEKLAQSNPDIFLPYVATIQNNLGIFYKDKNDYAAAEKSYLRALEIREKLAQSNPDTYHPDVAQTQNNLGNLYSDKNDYASAEKFFHRALEIWEKLAQSNPDTWLPDVAMIQNNLGNLYSDKNDYGAAEKFFHRALEIREKLALSNPDMYLPDVADTQNDLGVLYSDKNDYAAAEKAYLRALEIYEKLAQSNPDTYLPYVATTQNNLGAFYYSKNDYAAAEKSYLRALKIREKLALSNPDTYLPDVAMTQNNLGNLYSYKNDYAATEKAYLQALEIYEKIVPVMPHYIHEYSKLYGSISFFYLFIREFSKAGESAQKGIVLDPTQEWIKTNLASSFLFTGQWDKAKAIYLELKDKTYQPDETKTYREVFLEDLNELEKAGITHPDVAKVRELLKEQ